MSKRIKYMSAAEAARRYVKQHSGRRFAISDVMAEFGHLLNPGMAFPDRAVAQQLSYMVSGSQLARDGWGYYIAPGTTQPEPPQPEPQPEPEAELHTTNGQQPAMTDHIGHHSQPAAAVVPYRPPGSPYQPPADAQALALASALADELEKLGVPYKYIRENGTLSIEWARP